MHYSQDVFDEVTAVLKQRRQAAVQEAAALTARATAANPRVAEIREQMAGSALRVVRLMLSGGDVGNPIGDIAAQNLALQDELATILTAMGESAVNLEPIPVCAACKDSGFTGGEMCACMRQLLKEHAMRRVSRFPAGGVKPMRFDQLRVDLYPDTAQKNGVSPRRQMQDVITYCRHYAADFSLESPCLLLRGPTGVGKTHLSLAIAGEVTQQGYYVVYGPVQLLLRQAEREHFGRADGNSEETMAACDLLILDDLGVEFAGAYSTSCLYNILNTRLMTGLPTIISTNLSQSQLLERYGEQIASRILGEFQPLVCSGKDIRQIRMSRRMQEDGC